jgi:hypothetical protein
MKKILTSNIVENVRRQPFNKASLEHIQEAFQEVFADLLKGLTDNAAGVVVLHGCVDSDPDADDYDFSAGAVLYNGEVFQVDAFTGSDASDVPVLTLSETFRAGDPVTFSDNNNYNVHAIRKLVWGMATAGSGIADFDELVRFKDVLKPNSVNADGVSLKCKVVEIGDWNMDADALKTVAHGISDYKKIRSIDCIIRNDADNDYFKLVRGDSNGGTIVGVDDGTPSLISLSRANSPGLFDAASYSATSYNRGWLTIMFVE